MKYDSNNKLIVQKLWLHYKRPILTIIGGGRLVGFKKLTTILSHLVHLNHIYFIFFFLYPSFQLFSKSNEQEQIPVYYYQVILLIYM